MDQGKDTILLFQSTDAALGSAAFVVGNSTENSYSIENDIVDEKTKFGRIVGYGENSEKFEFTAYAEKGDPGQKAVLDAIRQKKQLKVWEADLNLNEAGKHDSLFARCIVSGVEKSAGEGFTEISGTLEVIGASVEGEIPALDPAIIEFARYGFEAPGESTGEYPNQETVAPA
ncbi:phage major tail protein, TP901-1 family [Planomicrobium okeanokoites]|uniref:phage major tail protein, TP901-1 family n=1 Tax=Planomicrobium okeanokoites TaxID=244 RepID=UPI000A07A442|nr:phage major tail protein, TP901-1 family [Planomicrobium okeanokoites]